MSDPCTTSCAYKFEFYINIPLSLHLHFSQLSPYPPPSISISLLSSYSLALSILTKIIEGKHKTVIVYRYPPLMQLPSAEAYTEKDNDILGIFVRWQAFALIFNSHTMNTFLCEDWTQRGVNLIGPQSFFFSFLATVSQNSAHGWALNTEHCPRLKHKYTHISVHKMKKVLCSLPQGADPPPLLSVAKAVKNHLNELNTPLLPTGLGELYGQTIQIFLCQAALLHRFELPL